MAIFWYFDFRGVHQGNLPELKKLCVCFFLAAEIYIIFRDSQFIFPKEAVCCWVGFELKIDFSMPL